MNSYNLEWFINIYLGCNLWLNRFTPLEDEIYPNHWLGLRISFRV